MHELSIALGLVDAASEEAVRRGVTVDALHVRIGALSGVVADALRFSYELASDGTPVAGSRLVIEEVGVRVHCPTCRMDRPVASVQEFRCAVCATPTADVVAGRELELFALEVRDEHSVANG